MGLMLLGVIEILGAGSFVAGFAFGIQWLMLLGGLIVVADDIREIAGGMLEPEMPVVLAVGLALLFQPWYVGVFWASAIFKLFNIPTYRRNISPLRRRYVHAR
jgi:hypothetical protein